MIDLITPDHIRSPRNNQGMISYYFCNFYRLFNSSVIFTQYFCPVKSELYFFHAVKWSSEETHLLRRHFHSYIYTQNDKDDNTGNLPGSYFKYFKHIFYGILLLLHYFGTSHIFAYFIFFVHPASNISKTDLIMNTL